MRVIISEDAVITIDGPLPDELSKLLGMKFRSDSPDYNSPVCLEFRALINYEARGETLKKEMTYTKLQMLSDQLKVIQRHDRKMLSTFRRRIKDSNQNDDYFGIRFEISIAAFLIKKNIKFQKIDPPDFRIKHEDDTIWIECTSKRIRKPRDTGRYFYKIESAIREKTKMSYANYSTALFLDITNLAFESVKAKGYMDDLLDPKKLLDMVGKYKFGGLVLINYVPADNYQKYNLVYTRVDHPDIQRELESFLDKVMPHGEFWVKERMFPREG